MLMKFKIDNGQIGSNLNSDFLDVRASFFTNLIIRKPKSNSIFISIKNVIMFHSNQVPIVVLAALSFQTLFLLLSTIIFCSLSK